MKDNERRARFSAASKKLDEVIVPLIGTAGVVVSLVALEDSSELQLTTASLFILALLVHYLSIETEVWVLHPWLRRRRRVALFLNEVVSYANIARAILITSGFTVLLYGIWEK